MGQNTKERYENIIRQDTYKECFKDFFYYFNENDPNDKYNTRDRKKFYNPHLNINDNLSQIRSERNSFSSKDISSSSSTSYINKRNSNYNISNQGGYSSMSNLNLNQNIQRSINEKINILNNIENKFSKIKILSSNNASRSAIKHYRHASTGSLNANNSTSNSSNLHNNINNNNNIVSNNNNSGYSNMIHRRSGSSANYQYNG
jgi:hypothetical protein